jgi:hypothetical protein
MTPRNRKRVARVGGFDALEDRVVLSAAQNHLIVTDVTSFYSNYVATIPGLVAAFTSAAAGSTEQETAQTNLENAILADSNNLATQLLADLGTSAAPTIRLLISGALAGGTTVTNTTQQFIPGSLASTLLGVAGTAPAFLGETGGIDMATDLAGGAAVGLTQGVPLFPAATFIETQQSYFGDIQPLSTQLATDQAAASTPPTTDQQAAINTDVAAIDAKTVSDVNALATNLLATMPAKPAPSPAIRLLVSGSTATTGVTFTGAAGSTANFGSLLATLQSIETEPTLLSDVNEISSIFRLFSYT